MAQPVQETATTICETPSYGASLLESSSESAIATQSVVMQPKSGLQEVPKKQPVSGKSGESMANTSVKLGQQPASSLPKVPIRRYPVRVGITWKKGERLEAQDFSKTWYPSKIVEISDAEMAVLIHFEGWNQRYDEWFPMTSESLRPTTRHSERKDKSLAKRRRVHCFPVYRPGDEVLARWKDCKKYPAKISRLIEEATYEVIFYDGVTHQIQAINIQPMPEEMKAELKKGAVPPKPKISFKQVKLNLPASLRKKQEQQNEKSSGKGFSEKILAKRKMVNAAKQKLSPKVQLKRDRELDIYSVIGNKPTPTKVRSKEPTQVTITCEATVSTLSEEECLKLFGSEALKVGGTPPPASSGTSEVTAAACGTSGPAPVPVGQSGSLDTPPSAAEHSQDAKGIGTRRLSGFRVRKRAYTDTAVEKSPSPQAKTKRRRTIQVTKKSHAPGIGSSERAKPADTGSSSTASTGTHHQPFVPWVYAPFVPSKAFVVEEDHNPFKCPHEGCSKDFRKESLLQYHIKYYHADQAETSSGPAVTSPSLPATTSASSFEPPSSSQWLSSPSTKVGTNGGESFTTANHAFGSVASKVSVAESAPGKLGADLSGVSVPVGTAVTSHAVTADTTSQLGAPPATPAGTHKRRRRKTDSICSTDSEMSASSRGKASSKRQRNDSEISVTAESPEVAGRQQQTDSSRLLQDLMSAENQELPYPDTEEADEDEMALDVVNCVCGLKQTAGLMIQCEVCMCWQHFKCTDLKKTGAPPANYVCHICAKPRGVRDSRKFLHDLDWERRGELPTYNFDKQKSGLNPLSSTAHLSTLATECNDLLANLQGIKRALHSTRRQIKISKEEDDPEFQLWQTDWDNWEKPDEDVTLSPRPGDRDKISGADLQSPSQCSPSAGLGWNGKTEEHAEGYDGKREVAEPKPVLTKGEIMAIPKSTTGSSQPVTGHVSVLSSSQSFSLSCTPVKPPRADPADSGTARGAAGAAMTAHDAMFPLSINTAMQAESKSTKSSPGDTITGAPNPSPSQRSSISPASSLSPSTVTPPMLSPTQMRPPQTPSIGRSTLHAPQVHVRQDSDDLVRDLFPGPAGDASASLITREKIHEKVSGEIVGKTSLSGPSLPENDISKNSSVEDETSVLLLSAALTSVTSSTSSAVSPSNQTDIHQGPVPISNGNTFAVSSVSTLPPTVTNPLDQPLPLNSGTNLPESISNLESPANTSELSPNGTRQDQLASRIESLANERRNMSESSNAESRHEEEHITEDGQNLTPGVVSSTPGRKTAGDGLPSLSGEEELLGRKDSVVIPLQDAQTSSFKHLDTNNRAQLSEESSSVTCTLEEKRVKTNTSKKSDDEEGRSISPAGGSVESFGPSSGVDRQEIGNTSASAPSCSLGNQEGEDRQGQKINGEVSNPIRGSLPGAPVSGEVNGHSTNFLHEDDDDDEDTQDNDTDTAEESADPYQNCEHNLLVHIQHVHADVETQLEDLEARIIELENSEHNSPTVQFSEENILNDVPALKKSLSKVARYLSKVQYFSQ